MTVAVTPRVTAVTPDPRASALGGTDAVARPVAAAGGLHTVPGAPPRAAPAPAAAAGARIRIDR